MTEACCPIRPLLSHSGMYSDALARRFLKIAEALQTGNTVGAAQTWKEGIAPVEFNGHLFVLMHALYVSSSVVLLQPGTLTQAPAGQTE